MLASNGNILSDAGPATDMSSLKLKLQIISKEEAISYGKNALKIGKYFVRIHPLVNAALNAYAIADYLYENKDAIQEHLRLKGDTVSFVENNIISAKEKVSSKKETRDISSIKVTSPGMPNPNDWEPDDDKDKHKEWEVKKYDKSMLHGKHGRFDRDPKALSENGRRLWWTKDTAEHAERHIDGGSKWKAYEETDKGLKRYMDVDKYGNYIHDKHQSNEGEFIPWKELRGIHINK